jgi:tRNA modification GTPase
MHAAGRTIFALATGAGRAAIAIMRVSGPDCGAIVDKLCRGTLPAPRRAVIRRLWLAEDLLDHALVLWFPAPHSYTGEDAAELQLHAGPAVIQAVADALVTLGAHPAEPGEFTRRAFRHGRLDLLEAEGIADLVEAETQAQRRQALLQTEGALSTLYENWSQRLRLVLAQQEALIDFPDEDLPASVETVLLRELEALTAEMQAHLAAGGPGERLRRGLVFAIIGEPNVGKSSLVNALAQRDAAIISPIPGTTRDALEIRVILGDVPVTLIDTAGLRDTQDPVEAEGVRRALRHAEQADLVIHVIEGGSGSIDTGHLVVCNKIDRVPAPAGMPGVSALTGAGLAEFTRLLSDHARRLTAQTGSAPFTRARHRLGISEATTHLAEAVQVDWPELRGEELRLAMQALGRLTGRIDVEDLLDTVFGQFCIGK